MSTDHVPCYNRFENETPSLVACSKSGGPDHCCYPDRTACATNGLCVVLERQEGANPYYNYDIGGCTVSDWDSNTCTDFCRDFNAVGVRACGSGAFCCLGTNDSCACTEDSPAYFTLDPVRILQPSESSAVSSTTSTSSSAIVSDPVTTSEDTTVAMTSEPTDIPAASSSGQKEDSSSSMAAGLGAGLGIGIPLTILVIAGLWFCRRRRGRKQVPNNNYQHNDYQPMAPETPGMTATTYNGTTKAAWPNEQYAPAKPTPPRYELPSQTGPQASELASPYPAVELPSGRY